MGQLWALVMVVMLYSMGSVIQVQAQEPAKPVVISSVPDETPEQYAERMQWFREAKFGWFICWGPCSLVEGEIGWSRNGPRPGIPGGQPGVGIPLEVYDNLYKQFNPILYNPQEWASLIKESGAKYVIFLTKHHDGFSLFNSKLSDYTIAQTPYRHDVTKELADALHAAGIRIIWYYSQPDWHHVGFDDPPTLANGAASEEEALNHYRRVRDEIRAFVEEMPGNLVPTDARHASHWLGCGPRCCASGEKESGIE